MSKPRYHSLRFHRQTRTYYVWDSQIRKRIYLGKQFDRANERLERLKAEDAVARDDEKEERVEDRSISINELLVRYLRHRRSDGADVRSIGRTKAAARFMRAIGEEPASTFRALALQRVRQKMLAAKSRRHTVDPGNAQALSRRYVNHLVAEIKAAWLWAASQELVPAETAVSLRTVSPLKKGKGGRESVRVPAVEPDAVELTLPALSKTVAAMVMSQRLAGCRPGELCTLRPRDISTSPNKPVPLPGTNRTVAAIPCGKTFVWVAVPESHKTLWRGKPRAIVLGPKVQAILKPFLEGRDPDRPLFSPREASDEWRKQHKRKRVYAASRQPGDRYTTSSYGRAVAAAIERVNRKRKEKKLDPIPDWRPNQLRHRAATDVAEALDRAHAAAFLGNGLDVIDVYADQELRKAARAALAIG